MKKRGWFSIELAICIVVFLVLMAVFLPKSMEFLDQGKRSKAQSDLSAIGVAVSQYAFEVGEYPKKLDDLNDYQYKFDKKDGFVIYSFGSDKSDSGTSVKTVSDKDIGYIGK